jgi:hypothetical protein
MCKAFLYEKTTAKEKLRQSPSQAWLRKEEEED